MTGTRPNGIGLGLQRPGTPSEGRMGELSDNQGPRATNAQHATRRDRCTSSLRLSNAVGPGGLHHGESLDLAGISGADAQNVWRSRSDHIRAG
jgi:hypothetical protein